MIWTSHPFVHRRHSRCAEETREATASLRRSVEQQQRLYQLLGNGVIKGWAFQVLQGSWIIAFYEDNKYLEHFDPEKMEMEIKVMEWSFLWDAITTVSYLLQPITLLNKSELQWFHFKSWCERFRPKKNNTCANFPLVSHGSKKAHQLPNPFWFR